MPDELLLTEPEACRFLGLSSRQLRTLRQKGRIPAIRVGERMYRYHLLDLRDFVIEHREWGTPRRNARAPRKAEAAPSSSPATRALRAGSGRAEQVTA